MRPTFLAIDNPIKTSLRQEVLPVNRIIQQFRNHFGKFLEQNLEHKDRRDNMANKEDRNNLVFDAWLSELLEEYEKLEKVSETDLEVHSADQKELQQDLSKVHTESMAKVKKLKKLKWEHEDQSRKMAESEAKMVVELSTSLDACRAASKRLRSTFVAE